MNFDYKNRNIPLEYSFQNYPEFSEKLLGLLNPAKKGATSEILKRARSLNSIPTFAATCVFIPVLLGFLLPKFVYSMTKKRHNNCRIST